MSDLPTTRSEIRNTSGFMPLVGTAGAFVLLLGVGLMLGAAAMMTMM